MKNANIHNQVSAISVVQIKASSSNLMTRNNVFVTPILGSTKTNLNVLLVVQLYLSVRAVHRKQIDQQFARVAQKVTSSMIPIAFSVKMGTLIV